MSASGTSSGAGRAGSGARSLAAFFAVATSCFLPSTSSGVFGAVAYSMVALDSSSSSSPRSSSSLRAPEASSPSSISSRSSNSSYRSGLSCKSRSSVPASPPSRLANELFEVPVLFSLSSIDHVGSTFLKDGGVGDWIQRGWGIKFDTHAAHRDTGFDFFVLFPVLGICVGIDDFFPMSLEKIDDDGSKKLASSYYFFPSSTHLHPDELVVDVEDFPGLSVHCEVKRPGLFHLLTV